MYEIEKLHYNRNNPASRRIIWNYTFFETISSGHSIDIHFGHFQYSYYSDYILSEICNTYINFLLKVIQ